MDHIHCYASYSEWDIIAMCSLDSHWPSFYLALGVEPPREMLSHITEITSLTHETTSSTNGYNARLRDPLANKSTMVSVGGGFPPVPLKLVNKIESGEFVDMDDLLPDKLGSTRPQMHDDQSTTTKSRRRSVTNILEWIQCFSVYIAVITRKQPERIQDLLGYQSRILEAHLEYAGDYWLGYDRRFRLEAAASNNTNWSTIDTNLWSIAFSGKAKSTRCKYCFCITHSSADCNWAPDPQPTRPYNPQQRARHRICFKWNNVPGRCPVQGCKFDHMCLLCANNPAVWDKAHKAIYCPLRQLGQPHHPEEQAPPIQRS